MGPGDRPDTGRERAAAGPAPGAPLRGVRVVDAASFLTGPLAAQALADLGAEVVKVEPPGGDPMRRVGRMVGAVAAQWVAANRTKRCVTLDLAGAGDREEMRRLLEGADVLVTNWRPGVDARLGLDPEAVRTRHPRLVWCRISGFGQDGPRAGDPAFDTVVQAASGLAATQGSPGRPQLVRGFLADKVTALYATQSILAALAARTAGGGGGVVDVSMLDSLAYFNHPDLMAERALAGDGGDGVNKQLSAVDAVPTADGWMVLAPVRGRQLRAAFEVAGHPEWVERLREATDPVEVTSRFFELISTATPSRTTGEWVAAMRAADVPAAAVLDADGHLADPQVVHNGTYRFETHPEAGAVRVARHPARWNPPAGDAPGVPGR